MTHRCLTSLAAVAALAALGGCTSHNLPETATPPVQSGPSVVTVPPSGTTIITPVPEVVGTLQPGTVIVVPGSGTSVPPGRLTAAEIDTLISGNTASGTTASGAPYFMHYTRGGTIRYHEGASFESAGTWRISPAGELCSRFNNINSGIENCYTLYRSGNNTFTYERPDGRPVGTFTVV